MERRSFMRNIAISGLGISLFGCNALNISGKAPAIKNWAWVSMSDDTSESEIDDLFQTLQENHIKAVLLKASKQLYKHKAIPAAKKHNLEIHAWFITLNRNIDSLVEEHPEWYVVNRNGVSTVKEQPYVDRYKWICPTKKPVQEYIKHEIEELAKLDGLSSIELDYIRFPDVILPEALQPKYDITQDKEYPEYDYCYCDDCRNTFKQEHGYDPKSLDNPPNDEKWVQFRYDRITDLVRMAYDTVHAHQKDLTAAVFPTPSIAKKLVRQEWHKWKLDAVQPMIYHNFYNADTAWIEKATREGVNKLSGKFPLYSGLFVPELNPDDLVNAVNSAIKGGAKGVSLFTGKTPEDKHWKAWRKAMANYNPVI